MRLEEERQLPFLCECDDCGCQRCVVATVEEFAMFLLFAPGHEPAGSRLRLVPDLDR